VLSARKLEDRVASKLMLSVTILSSLLVIAIAVVLLEKSTLILTTHSLSELLLSSLWHPSQNEFGFYPYIVGTLWVTGLAMAISTVPSLLMAIYLAEYAPARVRSIIKPMVDLLAGIPSVVYGLWALLLIVPLIRNQVAGWLGVATTGYTVLAGGIVLAVMVTPITISVSEEVIRAVPRQIREASMALGATRWQTVKHAVIRSAFPGIIAAVILGFGRAFGETIAVLMVVGNVAKVPASIFDPAYPIPALIANNYGEMMSIPSYESAFMFAALLLLLIVLAFSILAAVLLVGIKRRYAVG
jgi:phosphate transport system permease protein